MTVQATVGHAEPKPQHPDDSLLVAFLQSALLTAISAGLMWCGSAVLARTRFRAHRPRSVELRARPCRPRALPGVVISRGRPVLAAPRPS
jgi:hypothetical protein